LDAGHAPMLHAWARMEEGVYTPNPHPKSYDGKGANGSKNRPHDAYPVRCRVPGYYEPCIERVRVCQLKKWRQLENWPTYCPARVGAHGRRGLRPKPETLRNTCLLVPYSRNPRLKRCTPIPNPFPSEEGTNEKVRAFNPWTRNPKISPRNPTPETRNQQGGKRERVLSSQPTGPNPLYHRDD